MWPGRSRRGFRRQSNMGLMLLLVQMCQAGFDRIPPVTLGTIALNVGVYLGIIHRFFKRQFPQPLNICAGVAQVWNGRDYWRLIEATFHHADDWHLYYNMVSFMWKGMSLERRIGSPRFLYMIAVFTVLVNTVMLYLNYAAAIFLHDASYISQCAVGFSGVVFAVKVVTTQMMPRGTTMIMGFIPVNSRLSCWFELVLIQVLIPNASFTGHLAGILVGLAYTKGPLKSIMEWPLSTSRNAGFSRPSYTYHRGTTSQNQNSANMDRYTAGLDENEQIRRATEESLRNLNEEDHQRLYPDLSSEMNDSAAPTAPIDDDDPQPPAYGWNIPNGNKQGYSRSNIDQDEVRRRRLERFANLR